LVFDSPVAGDYDFRPPIEVERRITAGPKFLSFSNKDRVQKEEFWWKWIWKGEKQGLLYDPSLHVQAIQGGSQSFEYCPLRRKALTPPLESGR